jgi:hypothetical protein
LLGLLFNPEQGYHVFILKHLLTFTELHGIRFQEIELFMVTAARISNTKYGSKKVKLFLCLINYEYAPLRADVCGVEV